MATKLAICLLLIAPGGAFAQDTLMTGEHGRRRIDSLDAVVIIGDRGAVHIRQTPIAIALVSSRTIARSMEPNIIDALVKNVPGLNAVRTGPNISKPFIRGLGYNRVLTLYDGVRQEGQQWGDEHGIEVDAYDVDRAEVIKGPASLLFGSDALAGVVSLSPFIPVERDGKLHGRWLEEYQSNNGLAGSALRLNYSDEHWSWAAKGSYRLAKNYTNAIDGRVYNTGFRETNAALMGGYRWTGGNIRVQATLYNNLQGIPDGSRDSLTRHFTRQIYEASADTVTKRPVVPEDVLNSYALSPLHQHIQHYRVYTVQSYKIKKGEMEVLLAFQQNIRREFNHPTLPQQAGLFVRLNTLNYGVRYMASELAGISLTAGLNGMVQANKSKDATDFPIPNYHLVDAGAYLYGKWRNQRLTVNGGIRHDIRKLDFPDFLNFPALHKTFTGWSPSLGMTWELTEGLSLKANLSSGYRSPNITEIASNGLDPGAHIIYLGNRDFVPEINWQQDLGISAAYREWSASISLFNNTIRHYIYLSQRADIAPDAQGNKTFQYEQASAHLYGAEAAAEVHPSVLQGFTFSTNIALVYGVNTKKGFAHQGTKGEYLPFIPPLRWISGVEQEIRLASLLFPSIQLKAGLEYNAAQNRYLSLYNTETATPAYTLTDIAASTVLRYSPGHTLQLQVQVANLFDKAYQSNGSRLKYFEYYTRSPDGHAGMYNMGRSFNAKMILPF